MNNLSRNVNEDQETSRDVECKPVDGLDERRYLKYVKDFDLDEKQQVELLQTLWWIMATFVDLGFGVDSVQRCLPALGEIASESAEDEVKDAKHKDDLKDTDSNPARGSMG